MLHMKVHTNEASSYGQSISSSHHQSLADSADKIKYNCVFTATTQQWLHTPHIYWMIMMLRCAFVNTGIPE